MPLYTPTSFSIISLFIVVPMILHTPPSMYHVYQQSDLGINLWGTPSLTAAIRELNIKRAQGFLLVFSITSLSSFHELHALHDQIIGIKDDPLVPLVIVGNKSDLEEDRAISSSRAFQMSQSWNNAPYYETSALTKSNVDEAFMDLSMQMIRKDVATWDVRETEETEMTEMTEMQNLRSKLGKAGGRAKKKVISELNSRCNIM